MSLNSTSEFIRALRSIEIEKDHTLISFDVKDLYPSIDTSEIIDIINEEIGKRFNDKEEVTTLQAASNLIIKESLFIFNNKFYRQKTGVPMGSPISGTLAEIKMRKVENKVLKLYEDDIKHWYRYVDDIFAVIKKGTKPEVILERINRIDPKIKFTLEIERENVLNYLDIKIIRESSKFETTVYRKPEAINEIINAKCKTPVSYKFAAIRSYINRAILICSNQILLEEEMNKIKDISNRAGYKTKTIEKLFQRRIKKLDEIEPAQKPIKHFTSSIPYDKGATVKLKNKQ